MTYPMILAPLFVQVILTLIVAFMLAGHRVRAAIRKEIPENIALREPNWPTHVRQVDNNYLNQFELPVLFYVLTILSIITRHADFLFVVLAWVFVVFRLLQAWIHVTSNNVRLRGAFYGVGALVLVVMWLVFMVRILLGLP